MQKRTRERFQKQVWRHYQHYGRHDLPWREKVEPYKVLVSELMLQQTQVDRVRPKYEAFLARWSTIEALASAPLKEVLIAWQGLGYNRRAKLLHRCAQTIVTQYDGYFPQDRKTLESLPGIGPYTAGAILAFAFNLPVAFIETNIRSVYLHHFYADQTNVSESELLRLVEETVDTNQPREWYWALMDYGSYIKKTFGNPNSRSVTYTKQSPFRGSDRQIRGAIIRTLSTGSYTRKRLHAVLSVFEDIRIDAQLERLLAEELIVKHRAFYNLPE